MSQYSRPSILIAHGDWSIPKNGMQGGLASCRVSRYSPKFFVLPMRRRRDSRMPIVRVLTWAQVRCSRWIGAVPRAEMMDVRVEKLFMPRHFWRGKSFVVDSDARTYICNGDEMLDHHNSLADVTLCKDHLSNPVR